MKIPWDWDSKAIQIVTLLVIVLLLFTPLFFGLYMVYVNPPVASGNYGGEDTFVSSLEPGEHSTDSLIRVSNYTDDGNETIEIAYFKFDYTPWPSSGEVVAVYFSFCCEEVISGGLVRFHAMETENPWSPFTTDFENITYANMPPYYTTPFATTTVMTNGTYTVILSLSSGPAEDLRSVVGFAVTSEQEVRLLLDSSEAFVESRRPRMIVYVTSANSLYLVPGNPLLLVPVLAAVILLKVLYQKVRAQKTAFTPS